MALNHVSPHRYGDKRALGIYRVMASLFMLILFIFLTVYMTLITLNRAYFTLAWWVSLGTFLFFASTLIDHKAYSGLDNVDEMKARDSPDPFELWKITTQLNSFCI